MFGWLTILLLVLWFNPSAVLADTPPDFTIVADEPKVLIAVWHGTGASYTRSIRLTAKGTDTTKRDEVTFTFLPFDLKNKQDGRVVDRQNIILEPKLPQGPYKLLLNTPKDFQVKVIGIEVPGTYEGNIEFWPQGADRDKSLILPMVLEANPAQPLTALPGTSQVKLNLSRGWLSKHLLSESETTNKRELKFKNPYQVNAILIEKSYVLEGEKTTYQPKPPQVEVKDDSGTGRQDTSIIEIPLSLKRDEIPPDRYTGTIFLKVKGAKETLELPVELTMRYGPGWGIIFLFVGIVLGWFVQWMNTKGLALAKIEGKLSNLKDQILKAEIDDQEILIPMLKEVREAIDNNEQAKATEELNKIEYRLDLLEKMHKIENYAGPLKSDTDFQDLMKEIRKKIDLGDDKGAETLLKQLEALKTPQQPPKMSRFLASIIPPLPTSTETPTTKLEKLKKWFREKWPEYSKKGFVWVFYGIMLLIFIYVGLTAIYLKNLTFGATPLIDYAALVLWGLGSDVASRNLQNVLAAAKLTPK